jgi:hypothetical protein
MVLVAAILVRYAALNSTSDQSARVNSATPGAASPAQWKDGSRTISTDAQGHIHGLESLPQEYSSRVVNALIAAHFERSNNVESAWAANELARARKDFPDSHLLLGVLECHAGHLQQARAEFNALALENPGVPDVQRLLAKLDELSR